MKFFVSYFGCRTNQAEIQDWVIELENIGYELSNELSEATFALLNTCSVTAKAEKDVLKYIEKNYKKTNIKWLIAGCTVNSSGKLLEDRYANYIFLDNIQKKEMVSIVTGLFPVEKNLIYHSSFRSRKFLKIQDGCNHKCSFCIVPQLRGKSTSISMDSIVEKASYFSELGYREIVLTGINLSSYGYDLFPRINILEVIREIEKIDGIDIIRLSSLDPRYVDYQFVKELSAANKVANSFHFSFQSGSNSVLRRMNRNQKLETYMQIMEAFCKFFPDANMGADFIIGYPGENDKEYNETKSFIENSGLTYLHLFPFSPRPGTKAAAAEDQVLSPVVKSRLSELKEINRNLKFRYRERFIDKVVKGILIEEKAHYSLVVTTNYLTIKVPPVSGLKKKLVEVKINRFISDNLCDGTLI